MCLTANDLHSKMSDFGLIEKVWKDNVSYLGQSSIINEWYGKIISHYNNSNRKYHNLNHLETKLDLFLAHQQKIKNKTAFVLALYFQYLEYDPKASTSHEINIEQFNKFSAEAAFSEDAQLCQDVVQLLEATGTNITEEHMANNLYGTDDKHYFLDIDMAVLGASPEEYNQYTKRVREEYSFLSDEFYKNLRLKVLQSFLLIPNIYATKEFRDKYEEMARENIQQEVDILLEIH